MSHDAGNTYLGPSGEPNLLLVLLPVSTGGWLARVEDRMEGLSWAGEVRTMPDIAMASLQRQIKRLARSCHVRAGAGA